MTEVGLPLLHEEQVDGVAASVFQDIRARMPFVPALFKALAREPAALLPAWLQARALYDDPAAGEAAERLRRQAEPGIGAVSSPALRGALRPFVDELPFMLLIAASLLLTLDGLLPLGERPDEALPPPGPVAPPDFPDRAEHELFPEICRVYGTQHLPSIYRMLAARGLLEQAWTAAGPFLASDAGSELVEALGRSAEAEASSLPQHAVRQDERARPVVEQLRRALPRNLVLAVALS